MIEFDRSLLYIILGAIILVLVFYFKKRKDLGKTS
jgi:LPXTG-motif cell wall-anchored protein